MKFDPQDTQDVVFSLNKTPQGGWIEDPNVGLLGSFATGKACVYITDCSDITMNPKMSDCAPGRDSCECGYKGCVGCVCDPVEGYLSMTLDEYANSYEAVCETEDCPDWSPEPCPQTGLLESAATKDCPTKYFYSCRQDFLSKKYNCKPFSDTTKNRISFCYGTNSGNCWDTIEECRDCTYALYDCPCNVKNPSSSSSKPSSSSSNPSSSSSSPPCDPFTPDPNAMGTCYWVESVSSDATENGTIKCQSMTKSACEVQYGLGWTSTMSYAMEQVGLTPDKYMHYASGSIWSCEKACAAACDPPPPDCKAVTNTYAVTSFSNKPTIDCACGDPKKKCGDVYCTSCEFCYRPEFGSPKCVSCDDPDRGRSMKYSAYDGTCPDQPQQTGNGCGCYVGVFNVAVGCGECEFCFDSWNGLCYPCSMETITTAEASAKYWQCSQKCIDAYRCSWEFTATFANGSWSFINPPYAGGECISPTQAQNISGLDAWTSIDCYTQVYNKLLGYCDPSAECPLPSQSDYPSLPTDVPNC